MSHQSGSRGPAVLVVDDHRFSREYTAAALRELAGSVKQAVSAAEALAAALHDLPDLIITDVELGGDSGFDLIRRLAEQWPAGRPLPRIVVLSAERLTPQQRSAAGPGVEAYLVKPIEPEQIRNLVVPGTAAAPTPPLPDAGDPQLHRLFSRELRGRFDELDECISRRDLAAAGAILHQLIASCSFCGERRLASKMSALLAACRADDSAPALAASYYSVWAGARRCLESW